MSPSTLLGEVLSKGKYLGDPWLHCFTSFLQQPWEVPLLLCHFREVETEAPRRSESADLLTSSSRPAAAAVHCIVMSGVLPKPPLAQDVPHWLDVALGHLHARHSGSDVGVGPIFSFFQVTS